MELEKFKPSHGVTNQIELIDKKVQTNASASFNQISYSSKSFFDHMKMFHY